MQLPSPIPHPLQLLNIPQEAWGILEFAIGADWPEGNEKLVWDLADKWYSVSDALATPAQMGPYAAEEVLASWGGQGEPIPNAFAEAWAQLGQGEDQALSQLLLACNEFGAACESVGRDIEGAKIEMWIEAILLATEIVACLMAAAFTFGTALAGTAPAMFVARTIISQIFKKLVREVAEKTISKTVREGVKNVGEQVAKRGLTRFAATGLRHAGEEGLEEFGTDFAVQSHQIDTGRRDGYDTSSLLLSGGGGAVGGFAGGLAGLGKHASGGLARFGENLARGAGAELLGEVGASLATGHGLPGPDDMGRSLTSGMTSGALDAGREGSNHLLEDWATPPGHLGGTDSLDVPDLASLVDSPSAAAAIPGGSSGLPAMPDPAGVGSIPAGGSVGQTSSGQPPITLPLEGLASVPAAVSSQLDLPLGGPSSPGPQLAGIASSTLDGSATVVRNPDLAGTGSSVTVPSAGGSNAGWSSVGGSSAGGPTVAGPTVGGPTVSGYVSGPAGGPAVAGTPGPGAGPSVTGPSGVSIDATTATGRASVPNLARSATTPGLSSPAVHTFRGTSPSTPHGSRTPSGPRNPWGVRPAPAAPRRPAPRSSIPDTPEGLLWEGDQGRSHLLGKRIEYDDHRRLEVAQSLAGGVDTLYDRRRELIDQLAELRYDDPRSLTIEGRLDDLDVAIHRLEDRIAAVNDLDSQPPVVEVDDEFHAYVNRDVYPVAPGVVETDDRSAVTGRDDPPPVDRTRPYGLRGGLREPLVVDQVALERAMPRDDAGGIRRWASPLLDWFNKINDGGVSADPTRGLNCTDTVLSLYETYVHGRPRVAAPRTFDAYRDGDPANPTGGELGGLARAERLLGATFTAMFAPDLSLDASYDSAIDAVRGQLLTGGPGSFAMLTHADASGGAHAWAAVNHEGTVLFLDPQRGWVDTRPPYAVRDGVARLDAIVVDGDARPMAFDPRDQPGLSIGWDRTDPTGASLPPAVGAEIPGSDFVPNGRRPEVGDAEVASALAADPRRLGELAAQAARSTLPEGVRGQAKAEAYVLADRLGLIGDAPAVVERRAALAEQLPEPTRGFLEHPDLTEADRTRVARIEARAELEQGEGRVEEALRHAASLDELYEAGIRPHEIAQAATPENVRRMFPALGEPEAHHLAELLHDPKVTQMLRESWGSPPYEPPLLAESVLRKLAEHPDLVKMMVDVPDLRNALASRPMTLDHLATHQEAIDALHRVVDEIHERGPEAVAAEPIGAPLPTPLLDEQRRLSREIGPEKERDRQTGFEYRRRGDAAYRAEYLDKLYADAVPAQRELTTMAQEIAARTNGEAGAREAAKDRRRAEDKIETKYRKNVSRLNDVAAAKIAYDNLTDLYHALEQVRNYPGVGVVKFDDRFMEPARSGYRDIQMNVRISNGHVGEFRLHLKSLDEIAHWEHSLYEVRRDLDTLAKTRSLTATEVAIRNGLLREEQGLFWQALQAALPEGAR